MKTSIADVIDDALVRAEAYSPFLGGFLLSLKLPKLGSLYILPGMVGNSPD